MFTISLLMTSPSALPGVQVLEILPAGKSGRSVIRVLEAPRTPKALLPPPVERVELRTHYPI